MSTGYASPWGNPTPNKNTNSEGPSSDVSGPNTNSQGPSTGNNNTENTDETSPASSVSVDTFPDSHIQRFSSSNADFEFVRAFWEDVIVKYFPASRGCVLVQPEPGSVFRHVKCYTANGNVQAILVLLVSTGVGVGTGEGLADYWMQLSTFTNIEHLTVSETGRVFPVL